MSVASFHAQNCPAKLPWVIGKTQVPTLGPNSLGKKLQQGLFTIQLYKESTQYMILTIYHRHTLAAAHYNFNLHRETKKRKADGEESIKVSYPKFKNGEATVRDVRVQPNFGE